MIKQQQALIETEGLILKFTDSAIYEICRVAEEVNRTVDNIGARRLYTIIERILEDISFKAPEMDKKKEIIVDAKDVNDRVSALLKKVDLSKYIL